MQGAPRCNVTEESRGPAHRPEVWAAGGWGCNHHTHKFVATYSIRSSTMNISCSRAVKDLQHVPPRIYSTFPPPCPKSAT
eukprot:132429-Rhodomonas_salina.1